MKRILTFFTAATLLASALPALASAPEIVRSPVAGPYLLNGQETRMVFPDRVTVETWGDPTAQDVETPALSRWLLSGVLPIREGSRLVKFGTDPMVYAVGPGGTLRWIKNEQIASSLYGRDWNRRVVTLFTSYFTNYRLGVPVEEAQHPNGTLLKVEGSPTVYYVTNGVARPFSSERAFRENRFSFDSVITASGPLAYFKGNAINAWEAELNQLPSRL